MPPCFSILFFMMFCVALPSYLFLSFDPRYPRYLFRRLLPSPPFLLIASPRPHPIVRDVYDFSGFGHPTFTSRIPAGDTLPDRCANRFWKRKSKNILLATSSPFSLPFFS
ncbi:hypothetical protein PM082_005136 [Marasmius tenuissimus]|nr:hypothetical protein PM082_005136 [Marasmius tenuissimus]